MNVQTKFKMFILATFLLALFLAGCGGPSIMIKSELQAWYRDDLSRYSGAGKLGYTGTDADFHHFIARPVDDFIIIKMPKEQLKLNDPRGTSELGKHEIFFYFVDPAHEFRKIRDLSHL